ncbi:MAG: hypothetical protein HOE14_10530 [Gemmatimonadales bacterium]|jgi:hypothetical protein|nr:hypothetical protein [Gemmatimonadales bacterium]
MTKFIFKVSDFMVDAVVVAATPTDAIAMVGLELLKVQNMTMLIATEHLNEAEVFKLGVVTSDVDHGVTWGVQVLLFG